MGFHSPKCIFSLYQNRWLYHTSSVVSSGFISNKDLQTAEKEKKNAKLYTLWSVYSFQKPLTFDLACNSQNCFKITKSKIGNMNFCSAIVKIQKLTYYFQILPFFSLEKVWFSENLLFLVKNTVPHKIHSLNVFLTNLEHRLIGYALQCHIQIMMLCPTFKKHNSIWIHLPSSKQ